MPYTRDAGKFMVTNYTEEHGLPQNSVRSMVMDHSGYLWIITDGGISRFDGHQFSEYNQFKFLRSVINIQPNPKDERAIYATTSSNEFFNIKDGVLTRGISPVDTNIYNPAFPGFLNKKFEVASGLPNLNIYQQENEDYLIPFTPSSHFYCKSDSIFLFQSLKKVVGYAHRTNDYWSYFRLNNTLYHLKKDGTITRFDKKRKWTGKLPFSLGSSYRIYWSNATNQAFVYSNRILYYLRADSKSGLTGQAILSDLELANITINSIYYDEKSEQIFIGSSAKGLFVYTAKIFQVALDSSKNADNIYYGQIAIKPNRILTSQGNLFTIQKDGSWTNQYLPRIKSDFRYDKYAIINDHKGRIWRKESDLLYVYDSTGQTCLKKMKLADHISQFYKDTDGRIWLGMLRIGLHYIDPQKDNFHLKIFIGPPLTKISFMSQDSDSTMWVGTGAGLFKIHLKNKIVERYKQFDGIYVRGMYTPNPNEIWVSTYENGLFLIRNGLVTKYPVDERGYLAHAHCITEDLYGFLWVPTNNGIFQFKKQQMIALQEGDRLPYYKFYNKSKGLSTNEFNGGCQSCSLTLSNGMLSFPSMDGLVFYEPRAFTNHKGANKIRIDQIRINDRISSFKNDSLILTDRPEQITINYSQPEFSNQLNQRFYYSISSQQFSNAGWYEQKRGDFNIVLTRPNPGNYTIQIKSISGFNKSQEVIKSLYIKIPPKWYETWWALSTLMILLLLLTYTILQSRLNRALRLNRILEVKVRNKTLTLLQTVRELEISQSQLQRQNQLSHFIIASLTHDIRSPLRFINEWVLSISTARRLTDLQTNSPIIYNTIQKMLHLTEHITSFLKILSKGSNTDQQQLNLRDLVIQNVDLLRSLDIAGTDKVHISIDSKSNIYTNKGLFGMVIHNLVDNAIKNNEVGAVQITSQTSQDYEELSIKNNGIEMPAYLVEWMNDRSEKAAQRPPEDYNGLGLIMIKRICEMLHVDLQYRVSSGTEVFLRLPKLPRNND
ncbi:sensor histidine kinase [Dyadobacter tibetensis]|uniref:sensor histidine kinase n=1 Tax=Dyadobacter tibetensis TaxID=1211851 RepID=UPI0004AD4542|nr:two-component regulator propeller domain-containing protein [Dyadobacter tibetensis]